MPFILEVPLALSVGPDNIFSTRLLIICCLVALIVLFIEKSTGSSTLVVEYDDDDVEVEKEVGFKPIDEVKFVEALLELLHMFIPDGLLFDFSEKASSITLSRVSWSREMYGTTPSLACEVGSLFVELFLV